MYENGLLKRLNVQSWIRLLPWELDITTWMTCCITDLSTYYIEG